MESVHKCKDVPVSRAVQVTTVKAEMVMKTCGMECGSRGKPAIDSRLLKCEKGAQVYKRGSKQSNVHYYSDDKNDDDCWRDGIV